MSKTNGLKSTQPWLVNLSAALFTFLLLKLVLPGNVAQDSLAGQALVDIAAHYAHFIAFLWFVPSLVNLLRATPTPAASTSQ